MRIRRTIAAFFPHQVRRELKELYGAVALLDFAVAAVMLFEPIYLFQQGLSLIQIMLFYIAVYSVYVVLLPIGAKFASRRGFEHGMLLSSPFTILYFLSLSLIPNLHWLVFLAPLWLALSKVFYWPAYHADFASFSVQGERGREISGLMTVDTLVFVLGPALGGIVLATLGFPALFLGVVVLVLLSNVPLLSTGERPPRTAFSYTGAFKDLCKPSHRRQLLSYLGFGEELIVLTVWPLFIFLVLSDFATIGGLIALSTLFSALTVIIIGRLADRFNRTRIQYFGVLLSTVAWALRLLVRTGGHVLAVDTFSRIAKGTIAVPLVAKLYTQAAHSGVLRSAVFFEMALSLGKIAAAVVVIALVLLFPPGWNAAFIAAAAFTLLYLFNR